MSAVSGAPAARMSGHRPAAGWWTRAPLLLMAGLLGFLILYPILLVVLSGIMEGGRLDFSAWPAALREPGLLHAVVNTIKVIALTQGVSFPIAVLIAWVLGRTDIPFARSLEFGFWALFFLPALSTTTGWLLLFDPSYGIANELLMRTGLFAEPPFNMYSYGGIVFAHIMSHSIAVKVMLLTPAFRTLDASLEEASQICGAGSLATLIRVLVPILAPPLAIAFLMSLIRAIEAFEIELFLGLPANFSVYSTKIYALIRSDPPNFPAASVLAVIVLALMIPLLVAQRWIATRRSYVGMGGQYRAALQPLRRARWPMFCLLLAVVLCMSVLPLGLQLVGSFMTLFGFFDVPAPWTGAHWAQALADVTFSRAFGNTLVLGLGTALAAVLLYPLIAYCTVRQRRGGWLDLLSWLPMTVPGIILGFGYLWATLQTPPLRPLYGTMGILVLVSWLTSMTLGVQVVKGNLLQLGKEIEEAGRIVGGSWPRTFRSIIVPLLLPAMAVVGAIVFSQAIRQVSAIVLLSTGTTATLSLLQLEFLSAGMLGPASVVGTVIVLMSLVAAGLVRYLSTRFGIKTR